jgi:hypothetical protein
MDDVLQGSCLCEAITYRIDRSRIDAGYCHCRLCRRASGAPVVAWLTVPVDGFAYVAGAPVTYHSTAHGRREFCGACGTPLVFRGAAASDTIDVTIASLANPAAVAPEYHIWRESRIAWFETADALPRHDDAGPDRSAEQEG